MPDMISLQNLQKVVEQRTVLDIEKLEVAPGEIAAIVGPSGSGNDILRPQITLYRGWWTDTDRFIGKYDV